jgi:proteasome lid subunit RPN8/RPN11
VDGPARAEVWLDPALPPVLLARELVLEAFAHARECYPEECCGLLLGTAGGPPQRLVRCANAQALRRARGETRLGAHEAFWMDEGDLLRALREADACGEELLAIYHSHVDLPAYLSERDLQGALGPGGRPLYPSASQLVLSVREGSTREAVCFVWSEADASYRGHPVRSP